MTRTRLGMDDATRRCEWGWVGGGANIIVSMAGGDSFRRVIALSEFMAGSI